MYVVGKYAILDAAIECELRWNCQGRDEHFFKDDDRESWKMCEEHVRQGIRPAEGSLPKRLNFTVTLQCVPAVELITATETTTALMMRWKKSV